MEKEREMLATGERDGGVRVFREIVIRLQGCCSAREDYPVTRCTSYIYIYVVVFEVTTVDYYSAPVLYCTLAECAGSRPRRESGGVVPQPQKRQFD